jgi:hypothetical protein
MMEGDPRFDGSKKGFRQNDRAPAAYIATPGRGQRASFSG